MNIIKIEKKSGGTRTIYVPDRKEKRKYRKLIPKLNPLLEQICRPLPCHGFMPNRSPVTNAQAHVGYRWSLSFDLKDFFDTVGKEHLKGVVPDKMIEKVLYEGAARQGLPTSPLVANLAAAAMDRAIIARLLPMQHVPKPDGELSLKGVTYTRYADDLTFSSNDRSPLDAIKEWLPSVVTAHKFVLNAKKTRLQWSGFGRRVITGVAVDDKGIYPTRSVRRRLRAALHQGNKEEAVGLAEWCKLKPPGLLSNRQKRRDANAVKRAIMRM